MYLGANVRRVIEEQTTIVRGVEDKVDFGEHQPLVLPTGWVHREPDDDHVDNGDVDDNNEDDG
jgi:hypothetical protein